MTQFELRLGISLPEEYRNFLLELGFGAGPYYGIFSPEESLDQMHSLFLEYEAEEKRSLAFSALFPLTGRDLRDIEARAMAQDKSPWIVSDWPCSGCLPICHQGCTYWSILVLTGEFAGRVWDLANHIGFTGDWLPADRPLGLIKLDRSSSVELPRLRGLPTFGEWYSGWLERCEADLLTVQSNR
jgi:hypothetical protein